MYLYEYSIIQRLKILDIICLKDANNIILLQYKVTWTIKLHLSPSILGIHNLGASL